MFLIIFLLSTAEAVLRPFFKLVLPTIFAISIVYRWGGIETTLNCRFSARENFYCLPLRRYWDKFSSTINDRYYAFLLSTAEAVLRQWEIKMYRPSGWQFLLSTAGAVLRPFHFFNLLIIRERYTWWQRKALFQEQTMQAWLIRNKGRNSVIM